MKERPIIFSGERIRAILDGRKTQTRRLNGLGEINKRPNDWVYEGTNIHGDHLFTDTAALIVGEHPPDAIKIIKSPYGALGDRLWVRENSFLRAADDKSWFDIAYMALGEDDEVKQFDLWPPPSPYKNFRKTVPSMHMPRWASRITLEIVNVRVERLQEISVGDIYAEGFERKYLPEGNGVTSSLGHIRSEFGYLWDSINGKRAPWSSNPYVWVLEFKKL